MRRLALSLLFASVALCVPTQVMKNVVPEQVQEPATKVELYEPDQIIDGKETTIALASTDYIAAGFSGNSFLKIIEMITSVLSPDTPEEDIDYFELIKEDVQTVVGQYINENNMRQIEEYKDDLAELLERYSNAPVSSTTYPDKNTMANSLSTAIVANRFLVEAVEWPHSMMLHYADIASIHILVLKDAAEVYSTKDVSAWWVDLNNELEHYIDFGTKLQNTVVDWRNDLVECTFTQCVKTAMKTKGNARMCYDVWTVTDHVADIQDDCRVISGSKICNDHCQAYQVNMNRDVTKWVYDYLGEPIKEWKKLKRHAAKMAAKVEN